jgi:hypothetical protein
MMKFFWLILFATTLFFSASGQATKTSILPDNSATQKSDSVITTKLNFDWLLKYQGKTTNSVVWDKRFGGFLTSVTPQVNLDLGTSVGSRKKNLKNIVQELIGGPPEDVIVNDNRYVILSGCRQHSCDEKAWLWCDTKNGVVIGALVHYVFQGKYAKNPSLLIFSRQFKEPKFPERFERDLNGWLIKNQIAPGVMRFVNGPGSIKRVYGDPTSGFR